MALKSEKNNEPIDFVIVWVDGSDPEWIESRKKYDQGDLEAVSVDALEHRYRDWRNLQYLFRGIEKFTPWVRKVHLVTCGQVPDWLDIDSEKLNLVSHEDYMPQKYLPTFNSNAIELNLHRIEGLSERFVLFNDDIFVTKPMEATDFFLRGLPRDTAILHRILPRDYDDVFPHILLNNFNVLNKNFNKEDVLYKHLPKWFSPKYGLKNLLRNLYLLPNKSFGQLALSHMASPMLKSTYREIWDKEYFPMDTTSLKKLRHMHDVNQYLIRTWQIAKGDFYPSDILKKSRFYSRLPKDFADLKAAIVEQRYSMICMGDTGVSHEDFPRIRDEVIECFDAILPERSGFEMVEASKVGYG